MDDRIRKTLDDIYSKDRETQTRAYFAILTATQQPVDWAYDVWNELLAGLKHTDNHVRAIAAQVLCNLAISDPENRMLQDLDVLLAVTKDERFVTARHTLQAVWKVGVAGAAQRQRVVEGLSQRFHACSNEKNTTLIRYDILAGLRKLYNQVKDESLRDKALGLIQTEPDLKYCKKYTTLWK